MSKVELFFEDIESLSLNEYLLVDHVTALINNELKELGELSVIFCSDNFLLEMNKQYLNHDYYTDIITFDYVEDNVISGDLFISIDRIRDNADKFSSEAIAELFRVVFHGVLHLIGYKDKTEQEQRIMRAKEDYYLAKVDFNGLKI